MTKHKSKLERFRDICEAVFFADERGIKPVPYQVAKEINYPQSHTTSYMNELARKKILNKNKNGLYSLPNFKSLKQLENADRKLQLGKYYSWDILEHLRNNIDGGSKHKVHHSKHSKSDNIEKDREDIDEEISFILDMINEFPTSYLFISKKDLLKWIEKEIVKLKNASSKKDISHLRFDVDLIIKLLQDSANIVK